MASKFKNMWELYKSAGAWGEIGSGVALAGTYAWNKANPRKKGRYVDAIVGGGIAGTGGALVAKLISSKMAHGIR